MRTKVKGQCSNNNRGAGCSVGDVIPGKRKVVRGKLILLKVLTFKRPCSHMQMHIKSPLEFISYTFTSIFMTCHIISVLFATNCCSFLMYIGPCIIVIVEE